MRSGTPITKRGTAILDEPEQEYAFSGDRSSSPRRSSSRTNVKSRADYGEDFAEPYDDAEAETGPRQRRLKFKLRTRLPISLWGRIATGVALLVIAGAGVALLMVTRTFLLHDPRFMIRSTESIEIQGNKHLTRDQLLDIFGEDVDRNIFRVSLADLQAQLEQLPWVQHAVVMRLLPGRLRVSLTERTPVAFVRQGSRIGLVDGNGVLLDMAPVGAPAQSAPHYSFPVVTGISANDPDSTRAARMKIFQRFTSDLDSKGEKISAALSEVDLSDPEDVKALIPENSTEVLVHFGDDRFLERYHSFQSHLAGWRGQYPNLRSVDMRYEREVVLDMGNAAPAKDNNAAAETKAASPAVDKKAVTPSKPVVVAAHTPEKAPAKAPEKGRARPSVVKAKAKPVVKHKGAPVVKKPAHAAAKPAKPTPKPVAKPGAPVAVTHAAPPPHAESSATPSVSAAARSSFHAKPAAGKPLQTTDPSHSSQVPSR